MSKVAILTSLYIRDGVKSLENTVDIALNKKKHKKMILSKEELSELFSVFNFVEVKKIQRPQHFIVKEMLRGIEKQEEEANEGGGCEKKKEIQDDIVKFRSLSEKVIGQPPSLQVKGNLSAIRPKLIRQQVSSWFSGNQVDKKLQETSSQLLELKKDNQMTHSLLNATNQKMTIFNSEMQTFFEVNELQTEIMQNKNIPKIHSQVALEKIQQKVDGFIKINLSDFFSKILSAVKLNEVIVPNKIKKKWDASLLLSEEGEAIGRKIKGKLLYSIEEQISQHKIKLTVDHFNKEYYIRQKKYGVHKVINNNNTFEKDETEENKKVENDQWKNVSTRDKKPKEKTKVIEQTEDDYYEFDQKPKSKSQFIPYGAKPKSISMVNSEEKQHVSLKYYDKNNINELKREKPSKGKHFQETSNKIKEFMNKYKKPSPLTMNNIDRFAYNYSKQKRINFDKSAQQTQQAKQVPVKIEEKKIKLLKYPIKIEVVEIYSQTNALICYHIDDISVKELTIKFIQDRLKYKENKVKIEYPVRYSEEQEEKVIKCMNILNCLGAEVLCQPESGYNYWNQVDEVDVMTVSWILELPVSQVVNCYSEFMATTLTKK